MCKYNVIYFDLQHFCFRVISRSHSLSLIHFTFAHFIIFSPSHSLNLSFAHFHILSISHSCYLSLSLVVFKTKWNIIIQPSFRHIVNRIQFNCSPSRHIVHFTLIEQHLIYKYSCNLMVSVIERYNAIINHIIKYIKWYHTHNKTIYI